MWLLLVVPAACGGAQVASASNAGGCCSSGGTVMPPPLSLEVTSMGAVIVLPLDRPAAVFTEMPPTLLTIPTPLVGIAGCPSVPAAPALALYMATGYVGLCVANVSALAPSSATSASPPVGFDLSTCSVPLSGESWRGWPPGAVPPHSEWFRNYHGVFAALPLGVGSASPSLLLITHGEHKNELCWGDGELYQGLINADVAAAACYSGFHNGSFSDCGPAYNAMVNGVRLAFTEATCWGLGAVGNASEIDDGPLVWPVDGYLNASAGKASYGVRQPGGVAAWDGAALLFWVDNSFETADVWAARSPPGAGGAAGTFRAYDAGASAWSLPTLPAGFSADAMMDFLSTPSPAGPAAGGRGTPMIPLAPSAGAVHFAAARLTIDGDAAQQLYLAVYSIVNYSQCWPSHTASAVAPPPLGGIGTRMARDMAAAGHGAAAAGGAGAAAAAAATCVPVWRLMLRVTADFVAFSEPAELADYASPGWPAAPLQYPSLLAADGTRQDEVDSSGFFVIGTCSTAGAPCGSTYGPQVTTARVAISVGGGSGGGALHVRLADAVAA